MSSCHKRLAKFPNAANRQPGNSEGNQSNHVQLVHTEQPRSSVAEVDPRYKSHCINAVLIRPDDTRHTVQALRDTGALQSLVSSEVLHNDEFVHTGETLVICGVTGEVVSVPLVQVTLNSSLCSGTYLCGLVATLPTGIALLVGNDMCNEPGVAHVNVVTHSMASSMATKATEVTNIPAVKVSEEVGVEQSHDEASPSEDVLQDLPSLFDEISRSVENFTREQLVELPKHELSLASPYNPGHDLVRSDVLLREWRDVSPPDAAIHQTVVPTLLRAESLHIALAISAAGCLCTQTKALLQQHIRIAMLWAMLIVMTLCVGTTASLTLLIPYQLANASECTKGPVLSLIWSGVLQSIIACFFDIRELISFSVKCYHTGGIFSVTSSSDDGTSRLYSFVMNGSDDYVKTALAFMVMLLLGRALELIQSAVPLQLGRWWFIVVFSCGVAVFACIICIHSQTVQTSSVGKSLLSDATDEECGVYISILCLIRQY